MATVTEKRHRVGNLVSGLFLGSMLLVLLYYYVLSPTAPHDGPSKLTSIGYIRISSCTYKGNFLGGAGYDCIVRNYSADQIRSGSNMFCAGFDEEGRLIGSPDRAADLYGSTMSPNEERVIRIYAPTNAQQLICAENGSIPPPSKIGELQEDLQTDGLWSETKL